MALLPVTLFRHVAKQDSEESGQGTVEYAFILVLIALVVIITVILLGNQTRNLFSNISGSLNH
jgi:Flp pilus assembly pilin Flp